MTNFLNDKYKTLKPYIPGEQPKDKQFIKLNTNESPFAPSPKVINAINDVAVSDLRLYEDPDNSALRASLSDYYSKFSLKPYNFLPTAGSDEALELAFIAYTADGVSYPDITYGFYDVFCDLHHILAHKVALADDFSININDYFDDSHMVVIANPNAPTSLALGLDDIKAILEHNPNHIVLIDEAYIDFGGDSALSLINDYSNLLVTQTFSKSRSLAGARIGFVAGHKDLITELETIKNSRNPYNITYLSQLAGIASISDSNYFSENVDKIIATRSYVIEELRKLDFIVLDSMTNFVFAKHSNIGGDIIYTKLREHGILVRHFGIDKIKDYNRITIGSHEQMQTFIGEIKKICDEV